MAVNHHIDVAVNQHIDVAVNHQVSRGVNPVEVRGRNPLYFGQVGSWGSWSGRVVQYYSLLCILCTGSMFESGDF